MIFILLFLNSVASLSASTYFSQPDCEFKHKQLQHRQLQQIQPKVEKKYYTQPENFEPVKNDDVRKKESLFNKYTNHSFVPEGKTKSRAKKSVNQSNILPSTNPESTIQQLKENKKLELLNKKKEKAERRQERQEAKEEEALREEFQKLWQFKSQKEEFEELKPLSNEAATEKKSDEKSCEVF